MKHAAEARVEAPANSAQKKALAKLSALQIKSTYLGGDKISRKSSPKHRAIRRRLAVSKLLLTWLVRRAPVGHKVRISIRFTRKVLRAKEHLKQLIGEAQEIVDRAILLSFLLACVSQANPPPLSSDQSREPQMSQANKNPAEKYLRENRFR
ncbi:MAG: hypothetical protein NVV73_01365 [Cellvibrionaceae bacterium]|nr:hypothetical protein [Cellvibrionaceae bacterium]